MTQEKDYIIYDHVVNRAKSIGKGTTIGAGCDLGKDVEIGENCNIQCHVSISNGCKVGNNVFLGPGVRLLNDKHMDGVIEPCVVEDDAKIGGGAIILPRVTIARNMVVGAGAVVVDNFPENSMVYGNPARYVSHLNKEGKDV